MDVLVDAGPHRLLLTMLRLVVEHGVGLLEDPEGVLDIDEVGIPHVVPAEGALIFKMINIFSENI